MNIFIGDQNIPSEDETYNENLNPEVYSNNNVKP